ncbi:MAG: alanine racemase, partial [Gammaproteobacteria bacterium]
LFRSGAGALGQACATLAEAEVMVAAGIPGVLLFTSVVSAEKIARLVALNARADGLLVAVDAPANVLALAAANRGHDRPLRLLIDCEVGGGRTGLASVDAAVALARDIAGAGGAVAFAGIQAYCGNIQAITGFSARLAAAASVATRARAFVEGLDAAGLPPAIVSGGGTGTCLIDAAFGVYTECQAGSYVFMDANYLGVDLDGSGSCLFEPALFVRTTVVSTAQAGFCITDAGRKEFARDNLVPLPWSGAPADARYSIVGDDMGRLDFAVPGESLALGSAIECVAPHAYATLNLYPVYHCVRGDTLVDIWPIDARMTW